MKTKIIVFAVFCALGFISKISYAQAPDWIWAKSSGGTSDDYTSSVAVDDSGNIYVAGYFISDTISFGSDTFTNKGFNDIFLVKYDANGNVLWAKSAGGTLYDAVSSVKIDALRNIYVSGYFSSPTLAFGTNTLTNKGAYDIFLAKYDANGNVLWAKSAGGTDSENVTSVTIDNSGNTYVTGYFLSSTLPFGLDTLKNASANYTDIFLAKYDTGGNVLWAKRAGGKSYEYANSIAVDTSGIYITGYYGSDTLSFGSDTLTNAGWWDIFLAKYDFNGDMLWAKSAGGTSSDRATSLAVDASGNIYVTGGFQSDILIFDSDTLIDASSNEDVFLAKYDASGNVLWAKNTGGTGSGMAGMAYSVTVDTSGNTYLAGGFRGFTIIFDSITLTNAFAGNYDIFLTKYNSNGNVLWAKRAGGTLDYSESDDCANSIAMDASGNIYMAGYFNSDTLTFGSDTLMNAGNFDMFIAKSGFIPPIAEFVASDSVICQNTCIDFTNLSSGPPTTWNWSFPGSSTPTSNMQNPTNICYATPGAYPVTMVVNNMKGADTIIHNILISPLPVISVMVNQVTLTSNATGNHQWYDCNSATIIPDETNTSFTATTNGSYAVIVTQNGCTDTSSCHLITSVGLKENGNIFNISVFPNPTTDYIKINIPEKAIIEILNMEGQIIKTINNEGNDLTIDLANLSSGVYIVKAKTDNRIIIKKFIKQ